MAALLAAALALTLSPSPVAAAAPAPDACTLLGIAGVRHVLGGRVDAGMSDRSPDGSESICTWTATKPHGDVAVQLDVHAGRTRADFTEQRRIAQGTTKTVHRLGDAAFSERARVAGHVFDDLWVTAGTVQFRLETLPGSGSKALVALATLVLRSLARVPASTT